MPSFPDLEAWMWAEACESLARAERLHRQFFRPGPAARPSWEPPIDVFENEREIWIVVALPGVDPGAVDIGIESDALVIMGWRRAHPVQRTSEIHRLEIPQGRFERRIPLPPIRLELMRRDMSDGCLTLTLRKTS